MYAKNSRTENSWNQIVNRFHEKIYLLEDEVDLDLELSSLEFSDESEPEADASCLRLIFLRSKSNAVGFFRFKFGGLFNGRLGSRATSVILTMEISSSESGTSPFFSILKKMLTNSRLNSVFSEIRSGNELVLAGKLPRYFNSCFDSDLWINWLYQLLRPVRTKNSSN